MKIKETDRTNPIYTRSVNDKHNYTSDSFNEHIHRSINSLDFFALFAFLVLLSCAGMKAQNLRKSGADLDWYMYTEKALEMYLKALEIEPDNADALMACGRLYYIKSEYTKAEEYLKRALNHTNNNWRIWNHLGWVYEAKNHYSEMRSAFQNAINYEKDNKAWNHLGLAKANLFLDRIDESKRIFQEVFDSNNDIYYKKVAASYLALIATLKGDHVSAKKLYNEFPFFGLRFIRPKEIDMLNVVGTSRLSFADLGGLRKGDIIVSVNKNKIKDMKYLPSMIDKSRYGETLAFVIERENRTINLNIILDFGHYVKSIQTAQKAITEKDLVPSQVPIVKQPRMKPVQVSTTTTAYTAIPDSQKLKLAAMKFQTFDQSSESSNLGAMIAEMFTTEIVESNAFKIVEREQLEIVLKELEATQSGIIDTTQAQEIGKMLGADVIVTGAVTKISDQLRIDSRIIEVKTGIIVSADRKFCTMDVKDISRAISEMTMGLADKFYLKNK